MSINSPYNRVILLETTIKIKWVFRTSGYWKSLGYQFTAFGDFFDINVFHLEPGSGKKVKVCCPMCGNDRYDQWRYLLKRGHSRCVNCALIKDFFGKKSGRLTPVRYLGNFDGLSRWFCLCECGNTGVYSMTYLDTNSKRSSTQSCGCYKAEVSRKNLPAVKRGDKHYNWNPNLTDEDRSDRRTVEYLSWVKSVYKRDGYKCVVCNKKVRKLEAHHLNCWSHFPEQRYNIENGTTVCRKCHTNFHLHFMGGWKEVCTQNDFHRFINERQMSSKPPQSLSSEHEVTMS